MFLFFCSKENFVLGTAFLITALKKLEFEKYDLLLLDMQLPNRFGESEPEENGGVALLEELEVADNYI